MWFRRIVRRLGTALERLPVKRQPTALEVFSCDQPVGRSSSRPRPVRRLLIDPCSRGPRVAAPVVALFNIESAARVRELLLAVAVGILTAFLVTLVGHLG